LLGFAFRAFFFDKLARISQLPVMFAIIVVATLIVIAAMVINTALIGGLGQFDLENLSLDWALARLARGELRLENLKPSGKAAQWLGETAKLNVTRPPSRPKLRPSAPASARQSGTVIGIRRAQRQNVGL
jgi:hypothetical protein